MKKGIVIRAFSQSPDFLGSGRFLGCLADFKRCFDAAAAAGFEGVQPYLETEGYFSLTTSEDVTRAIAQAARRAGIALSSLEIKPFSFSFTSDDDAFRAASRRTVRRAMEIAAAMEITAVLVIPGYVGLPHNPAAAPVRYDLAYQRTREALQELAPDAQRLGVAMLLENVWNKFLLSPLEMRSLVDEVGSRQVGVLFDTGNVLAWGYPEQWIRILGPRIREVHLKDYRESVGTVAGFVDLLEGDVNWPEVVAALREIGYAGFLTAEVFPYRHHGDAILRHTAERIDRILGRRAS